MEVSFSENFKKVFRRRIAGTKNEISFYEKLQVFTLNPFHPQLKTHKLSGKLKGLWSFTIEYNVRVVFFMTGDKPPKAVFIDISTHDQVY